MLHPLALGMIALCGVATLLLPRRYAIWPSIVIACFVSDAQRLVIAGLDFNLLRLMVTFGWCRILIKQEAAGFRWRPIDTAVAIWAAAAITTGTLLEGSFNGLVNRLGQAFDAVGMYFMFRCWIRSWADFDQAVFGFILASVPVAVAFIIEKSTGRNAFAVFGGVPEITAVRDGKLRCGGAFAHPIIAGCFWAALMPLFAARYWQRGRAKTWGFVGLAASCLIIIGCASSTPVMSVLIGGVGALFFFVRRSMRLVRWTLVCTLIALHMVMKAPVWHLISRVDIFSGSTGWHRYHLINQAILHFDEWFMVGTTDINSWQVWANDVTNQYVFEGICGGIGRLIPFIAIICVLFAAVGRLWRSVQKSKIHLALAWALGVSLFIHVTNFFVITYFGQIWLVWYLTLAMIASLDANAALAAKSVHRRPQPVRAAPPRPQVAIARPG